MDFSKSIFKGFGNLLPLIFSVLPVLLIIGFIILIVFCFVKKVRIKFRTFTEKGFRPIRGNFGLYVYNGKQGTGKTYSVVEYLLDNKNNITVFNNIAEVSGLDYVHYTGFKELLYFKEILDYVYSSREDRLKFIKARFPDDRAEHILMLLEDQENNHKQLIFTYDEIFTELLKGSKLSKDVIDFLCQMRKRGIIFLTTCQEWAELPLSFRRFCRYEIDCKMIPVLWTGFLIKTFKDAENMKWSNEDQEHIAPLVETTITKTRKRVANSYDTFLRISSISANSSPTSFGEMEQTPGKWKSES